MSKIDLKETVDHLLSTHSLDEVLRALAEGCHRAATSHKARGQTRGYEWWLYAAVQIDQVTPRMKA